MPYDRSGAYASQDVILSIYFAQNGTPSNVFSIGDVLIYDPNDALVATIASADVANPTTGLYKVTYSVPSSAAAGTWRDLWTNIKFTPLAEYVESPNFFFVVPETQIVPNSTTGIVYTYIRDANASNKAGVYGYAELIDPPYYIDGVYFANPTERGTRATSDANGRLEWELPQGARVRFRIPTLDLILEKTIHTSSDEVDLYDLGDV